MQGKTRMWIAMVLLFASGVAVGFFGSGLLLRQRINEFVGRGPSGMHTRVVQRALRDLDLSLDQRRQIDMILDETEPRMRMLGDEFRTEIDRALDEQHERIKAVLTEQQRADFERRLEEMRQRFERMRERDHRSRRGPERRGDPPPPDHLP